MARRLALIVLCATCLGFAFEFGRTIGRVQQLERVLATQPPIDALIHQNAALIDRLEAVGEEHIPPYTPRPAELVDAGARGGGR